MEELKVKPTTSLSTYVQTYLHLSNEILVLSVKLNF
jgi:hypothetical protein